MLSNLMEGYIGTRDFLPEEWNKELYLLSKWRSVSKLFGFEEYDAPTIENVELFTKKSGEGIKNQLFWFKDKGERDICLRAELTPQLARFIINYGKGIKKPIKWFSIPRCFRYERPQKGRWREFIQYNADIIGEESVLSTVEILNLAIKVMESFGLNSRDVSVKVNSRVLIDALSRRLGVGDAAAFYLLLDKRYKIGEKEFMKSLKLLVKEFELAKQLFKLKDKILIVELEKLGFNVSRIKRIFELVDNNYLELDLSIVRGLDYYTDIVFEGYDRAGEFRSLFGGGEYNNLISDFGGAKTPAVGFAMSDSVMLFLDKKKLFPKYANESVFVATVGGVEKEALKLREKLVRKGVAADLNLSDKGLSKQFEYCQSKGISKVYILGEKEVKSGTVTVKDLITGSEKKVKMDKL